jgi:hypothetical protein
MHHFFRSLLPSQGDQQPFERYAGSFQPMNRQIWINP